MGRNQSLGSWGEAAAATFLQEHGYQIVARNVRTPYGEIDLIAAKDGYTIFVEVKSRASHTVGQPEVSVTRRKQQHMLNSAAHYAQAHAIESWQIDVIAIQRHGARADIKHFENAVTQPEEL